MDRYNDCITKGKWNFNAKPTPGIKVLPGSELAKYYPIGTTTPDTYTVEISFDNFLSCIESNMYTSYPLCIHFKIYDEAKINTREELILRYQFLKYLNQFNNCIFEFSLSDSTLPAYIAFMNKMGWRHEDSSIVKMTVDRNPTTNKDIPLEQIRSKLIIDAEHLQLFKDQTIRLAKNKLFDGIEADDALKLKKIVPYVSDLLDKNYYTSYLSDYEKAFIIYHYLFDNQRSNNVKMKPLSIKYAFDRTFFEKGVQKLNSSPTRWESRSIGTLEHKKGVCSGQAKLFSSLLSNPKIKIPSEATYGIVPSGENHCWSSMVINNKLYQCCTTIEGLFANLDNCGYMPYKKQVLSSIYPHASLNDLEKYKIKRHIKKLER